MDDYMNDFLKQLQEGKSVDNLAAELTAAINAASKEYDRIQEAERKKAEEAKEASRKDKVNAVTNLLFAWDELMATWGYESSVQGFTDADVESIVDDIDSVVALFQKSADKKETETEAAPTGDPIEDFLNKFVR